MKFFLLFLCSFVITYFSTPLIIRIAKKYRCLDKPGKRKVHSKAKPRWGGVAFFLGIIPATAILGIDRTSVSFMIASFLLFVVGVVDDRIHLRWPAKFGGMIIATAVVVFGGNIVVHHLGSYGNFGMVELGPASIPFTFIGIIGVTNAINLIDGLNGLAAGISLLGFFFIGFAAAIAGNYWVAGVSLAFVGGLAAFMRYNFPRAKIFMGDSGSLFLGFSLAVLSILLTQDPRYPISPMFPVLVLLIPIFDALRVMVIRLSRQRNPFHADKIHLHHLIIRRKLSHRRAVIVLWLITVVLGCLSLVLLQFKSASFMIAVVFGVFLLGMLADALSKKRRSSARQVLRQPRGELSFNK